MKYTGLLAALMLLAGPVNAEPGGGLASFEKLRKAQAAEIDRFFEQQLDTLMQKNLSVPAVDSSVTAPRAVAGPGAVQRLHLAWLSAR